MMIAAPYVATACPAHGLVASAGAFLEVGGGGGGGGEGVSLYARGPWSHGGGGSRCLISATPYHGHGSKGDGFCSSVVWLVAPCKLISEALVLVHASVSGSGEGEEHGVWGKAKARSRRSLAAVEVRRGVTRPDHA